MEKRHFVFVCKSSDRVPGGGDPLSWLTYYKLNEENDETFVAFTKEGALARPGDILWFIYNYAVLARVEVLRIQEDSMSNGDIEIWYDARKVHKLEGEGFIIPLDYSTGMLSPEVGEEWMNH